MDMTDMDLHAGRRITAEWMSVCLGDLLPAGEKVIAVSTDNIGAGVGFAGTVIRVRLQYDRPTSAPESVIVKLPHPDPGINDALHQRDLFFREARFYRDLGPEFASLVPGVYHIEIDEAKGDYVIVMQDFGSTGFEDQDFMTVDQAKLALAAIAQVHARYWNHPSINAQWLMPITDGGDRTEDLERLENGIKVIKAHDGDTDYLLQCAYTIQRHFPKAPARFPLLKPYTLLHGDFHGNNVALTDKGVVLYDWQIVSRGIPATDVMNFVFTSVPPEDILSCREELLQHYHAALVAEGVGGYSFRKFRQSCDEALYMNILKYIVILGLVDFDVGDGKDIRDRTIDAICTIARETNALGFFRRLPLVFLILRFMNLFVKVPGNDAPGNAGP